MDERHMDERQVDGQTAAAELRIEATLIAKLNLADFQNAIPVIRELWVVNESERTFGEIELTLFSDPAFLKPQRWRIDTLAAGARYPIRNLDPVLDGGMLGRLTEAETATVSFALRLADNDDPLSELARREFRLELLPRNQWGGLFPLPDLVAAFVQPNEPAVARLLKQAAEILRKNGKDSALNGYAGGAHRAWELASAVWGAVVGMGLDYALPPASFEASGQKVRGPGQIVESGLATCLDLALLFCAALEQAGLNPLLVFTEGHAFAGVWLKAEMFSTTVVDDVTALRKRLKLKELLLFETTLVTQRPAAPFSHAVERGAQQVDAEQDAAFRLALDICRARLQRIKPLASGEAAPSHPSTPEAASEIIPGASRIEDPPFLPEALLEANEIDADRLDPRDRLARWQRKLLDLSLRNNLLNFREGKKSLKLEAPDPDALEDLLSTGQPIKLLQRPDLMDGADPRDRAIYEAREREDIRRAHALDALRRREVFVALPGMELESRLVELFRSARNALQEGGANTLYLAFGFLSWTRDDRAGQRYRAPLVLAPVSLHRKSVRSGFTLTLHEDEPRFNPTLIEMLRQDFHLNLGVVEGELPRDDAGLDIRAIWRSVAHAVKEIKGWEVSEEVALSMFSFAKFLMWKDLSERTAQLRQNPVVRHLLDTPREAFPPGAPFPEPNQLDRQFDPSQVFCPLPVDSSQLSAVLAASKGKDFVLIGPPGTGKSQTIANLIAQSLAEGRKVLFVSEKISALDVVYRRLREIGLGEFCLELHSSKARKLDVLAQLQSAWESRGEADDEQWRAQADKLKRLRDALNAYVERLHLRHPNGLSIFEAIGRVSEGRDVTALPLAWDSFLQHNLADMERLRETVDRLEVNARAVGHANLIRHPLALVGCGEWSPSWQQQLIGASRDILPTAQATITAATDFLQAAGLPTARLTADVCRALAILAERLPTAAGHDWRFILRPDAGGLAQHLREGVERMRQHAELNARLSPLWSDEVVAACEQGLELLAEHQATRRQLSAPWSPRTVVLLNQGLACLAQLDQHRSALSVSYGEGIESLDVAQLQRDWEQAGQAFWPKSWLGRRKVKARLAATIVGQGAPDVGHDLQHWNAIRDLREQVRKLAVGQEAAGVWKGLDADPDVVRCALCWQPTLAALHDGKDWKDVGFEFIETGRCGEILKADLGHARRMRQLEQKIAALAPLEKESAGLWAGHATQREILRAALDFLADRRAHPQRGALTGTHPFVSSGRCGAALADDHRHLQQRAEIEQALTGLEFLREATANLWKGLDSRLDDVAQACQLQADLAAAVAALAATPDALAAWKTPLNTLLGDANALLEPGGRIAVMGARYIEVLRDLQSRRRALAATGQFSEAAQTALHTLPLPELLERCQAMIDAEHGLKNWCAWRHAHSQALALGLTPLAQGMEQGAVLPGQARTVFETNYARGWLNAVVDAEPVIRNFVSAEHEQRIRDFRELDARFTTLTRDWLRARLCTELPKQDSVSRNSEWGVLRHEMSKKRAHLPLRELMARVPTALTKLAPCLLMSPLSIAQYLDAAASAFDLVIFDEASQIPVWDAIGAIARGRQVVMVGDPKQLPPTAFFDRAESDLDDEDVETDLESILDECIGANLPTLSLNWHYRSRHESLIAFSNHNYYEGKLVTFPSPVTNDRAVSLSRAAGTYEKGGSRTNPVEARALVDDVVARLSSPDFCASGLTIGVVTFNSEQQKLIEDLLDAARRQDPRLEVHFAESKLEPVFVKNLESVQGDERDIIYFSIAYGPDAAGQLSMNFGPLNRQGGERRLNVAITRARHALRVFASLRADQMDLTRTQALGVRDLKHFLEFAEHGAHALVAASPGSLGGFDSPFERAVATALSGRGWRVQTQIGASSFRIDLGVIDPDAPGRYLAGIECDGATYHRSVTAKDRDKLREQVLRGLGWEILRVWSTDWWIDPDSILDKLDADLREIQGRRRRQREEEAQREEEVRREEEARQAAKAAMAVSAEKDERAVPATGMAENPPDLATSAHTEGMYARQSVTAAHAASRLPDETPRFQVSDPAAVIPGVNPDAFFEPGYDSVLSALITHVLKQEGPVLDDVLARRIARAHGWVRTGTRIRERVARLAQTLSHATKEDVGVFYWPEHLDPTEPLCFRRPADENNARPVDEICPQELAALAREVTTAGAQGEAALSKMAQALGLQQLRAASRVRLMKALQSIATALGA
jgi:very-short-patch-repair endonuclease